MGSGDIVGSEIAGALAGFWAGGAGPSHASISTAFALAGCDEPGDGRNKQDRILYAIRSTEPDIAARLVDEFSAS